MTKFCNGGKKIKRIHFACAYFTYFERYSIKFEISVLKFSRNKISLSYKRSPKSSVYVLNRWVDTSTCKISSLMLYNTIKYIYGIFFFFFFFFFFFQFSIFLFSAIYFLYIFSAPWENNVHVNELWRPDPPAHLWIQAGQCLLCMRTHRRSLQHNT